MKAEKRLNIPFSNTKKIFLDLNTVIGLLVIMEWRDIQIGTLSNTCPDMRSFRHWRLKIMLNSGHSVYSKLFREQEDAISLLKDTLKRVEEYSA